MNRLALPSLTSRVLGIRQFLIARRTCYLLCLDTKKVTKEKSRLQIILGLLFFGLPTQYNSPRQGGAQTVLLTLASRSKPQNSRFPCNPAPSLKLPAGQFFNARPSQNSLRPSEIQNQSKVFGIISREVRWQTENGANCRLFGGA